MKAWTAALLLAIAVGFTAIEMEFMALSTIIILVMMAAIDMGGWDHAHRIVKSQGALSGEPRFDEGKWAPPGKPANWGRMPNEELGNALYGFVARPINAAK